jgi:hypothetical protein
MFLNGTENENEGEELLECVRAESRVTTTVGDVGRSGGLVVFVGLSIVTIGVFNPANLDQLLLDVPVRLG